MNQFLDVGFAERKIIMTTDILRYCQAKHHELIGKPPHLRTRRKIYSSAPIGGTEVHTIPKVNVKDSRSTSPCSERQPPMVDYRAALHSASPLPDSPPRSLSVSPIEGLGSSPRSSPCKDSTLHGSHLQLHPPTFIPGLGNSARVDPPSRANPPPTTTCEAPKMEGLVIRHKEESRVTKATGLHTHSEGPEEADRGDGVPSFAPFLQRGLDQGGKEKPRDGAESVISWESLPLHDEQRRHDNQDGGHDQDDGREVCSKIDQLTQMIEKLSARFVIFETQMKLVESQRGKAAVNGQQQQQQQQQGEVPNQPEDKDKNKPSHSIPPSLPPPPSGPTSTMGRASGLSDPSTDHFLHVTQRAHSTIPPKPLGTAAAAAAASMGAQDTVVREQWRQMVRTELGSPLRTPGTRPSLGKSTLLGGIGPSPPVVQSPSTPEDTRRLIEGLRQRAKKTKEFLDKATL
eukprot:Em0022g572a